MNEDFQCKRGLDHEEETETIINNSLTIEERRIKNKMWNRLQMGQG